MDVDAGDPRGATFDTLVPARRELGAFALAVGPAHLYFAWSDDPGDIWVMDVVGPER